MLKDPPAQQILNEQCYLIMRSPFEHKIGEVLPDLAGGKGFGNAQGPIVVIGTATREEWAAQYLRFAGQEEPPYAARRDRFYKVTAE